ncbi:MULTISPECIES: DUF1353 domain-containing protein [Mesorhizobium]|uniref:DUF1353 domain-containing protein n=1 Tax=Mesorhizobium opportunistum (strain LMG 24607 / HAMBI 3007 / WSM2075) TaxID=536019 RepID=F7Y448_MESOW|nr:MULTISPECIES: DUF1353 domain-containing protein [Mesorhizobium]AEH85025.1 protein of unknown function DUF1353 [Mesorhizobium opportunistum WSM2075]MCA0029473.1 DUF1353 domain-containing protein [Mesorhizobium sp. B263B2A]
MADKKSFMKIALTPTRDIISPPVPIVPFADWDYYYTTKSLEWRADKGIAMEPVAVSVPAGFVTDLASIPPEFWSGLPPAARYSYPAIVHDYLYWFQPCKREEADGVLKAAMADMKVSSATAFIIYQAVRLGGGRAWDANATMRDAGERRVLCKYPSDVATTWNQWKQQPNVFTPE